MSSAGEELELSTTGERLAQISFVLGLVAAIQLIAGATLAFEAAEAKDAAVQLGAAASGVAFLCFLAAVLLRWAGGPTLWMTRAFVVVLSGLVTALIALGVVVGGADTFDAQRGYGLNTVAAFVLSAMAVVFAAELVTWWMTRIDEDEEEDEDEEFEDYDGFDDAAAGEPHPEGEAHPESQPRA